MAQKKQIFKNIFRVVVSRGATLISGVAVGFLLPRILGVTGYGYLRIFTLYFTYTSLLHFGFADGILLRYAGKEYESLDKKDFRAFTVFFALFQFVIAVLFCVSALFFGNREYAFIAVMIGADLFFNNMMTYYMFISQATQRFKEYSARSIILAVVKLGLVGVLFLMYLCGADVSYHIYLCGLILIDFVMMLWYVYTYRDITFGERSPFSAVRKTVIGLFRTGIVLTVAYQVAHFVFVLDNQFVNIFYDTDTFGIYAFAYSIVTMISTLISSTSAVLLPVLKSLKKDDAIRYYDRTLIGVTAVSGLSMILVFPLERFIKWFLPQYTGALGFLRVVMPSLLLSACISIVMFTFYKVLDKHIVYLYVGIAALATGFLTNVAAQFLWKTPYAISWASVITVFLWYGMASVMFVRKYGHRPVKNFCYILILAGSFYGTAFSGLPRWIAAAGYFALFSAFTAMFYGKDLRAFAFQK